MSNPDMSDPELLAWRCAEAMLVEDEAVRAAGVTIDDVGPGRAAARMRVGEAMISGHSLCHGGYVFLLADTALALACNSGGEVTVTQACDVVERLRYGRNGICDVTVRRAGGEVIAEFRGRSRGLGRPLLD
jgi:acyl-CoA thioesterase